MYQYYVVEVIKTQNGEFEHNVFWLYDQNDNKARLKGQAKYHEILATAAVSNHKEHSAILFSSRSEPLLFWCYDHYPETE